MRRQDGRAADLSQRLIMAMRRKKPLSTGKTPPRRPASRCWPRSHLNASMTYVAMTAPRGCDALLRQAILRHDRRLSKVLGGTTPSSPARLQRLPSRSCWALSFANSRGFPPSSAWPRTLVRRSARLDACAEHASPNSAKLPDFRLLDLVRPPRLPSSPTGDAWSRACNAYENQVPMLPEASCNPTTWFPGNGTSSRSHPSRHRPSPKRRSGRCAERRPSPTRRRGKSPRRC